MTITPGLVGRLEPAAEAVEALETPDQQMWVDAWARVLTSGLTTPLEVAYAAGALRDINFRDALIAHMCPGLLSAELIDPETLLLTAGLPKVGEERSVQLALIDHMIDLCALTQDSDAAPALTVLANFAWSIGDGALTHVALDRALRCEPDYRLARLLDMMVGLGMRPTNKEED